MSSPMPDLSPIGNEATAMSYAELVDELNAEAERLSGHSIDRGSVDAGIASVLASKAAAAIETLERERDEAREAADEPPPWPRWADEIVKKLQSYGVEVDPFEGWDLPNDLDDWLQGAIDTEVRRAEAAEAQVAKLKEALEPFAGIGELIELETEGFSDSDEFELLFGDDLRFDRIAVGKFRRAREALKDTSP